MPKTAPRCIGTTIAMLLLNPAIAQSLGIALAWADPQSSQFVQLSD
jgi:hypothetical protein